MSSNEEEDLQNGLTPAEFQNLMVTVAALHSVLNSGVAASNLEETIPNQEENNPHGHQSMSQYNVASTGTTFDMSSAGSMLVGNNFSLWPSATSNCKHATALLNRKKTASIAYCDDCSALLLFYSIAPASEINSAPEKTLRLPRSLLHDTSIKELVDIYNDLSEKDFYLQKIISTTEQAQRKLCEWQRKYRCNGETFLCKALQETVYESVEKNSFLSTSHYVVSQNGALRMSSAARRTVPLSVEDFVRNTKELIAQTHQAPFLYPTCGSMCTICNEQRVNIRLHIAHEKGNCNRPSTQSLFKTDDALMLHGRYRNGQPAPGIPIASLRRRLETNAPTKQVCECVDFSVCIDCLLKSYWHSTNSLEKSFAHCPTCRAEYHLADIIPVYNGKCETASHCTETSSSDTA